jgi:hypothetical protein
MEYGKRREREKKQKKNRNGFRNALNMFIIP